MKTINYIYLIPIVVIFIICSIVSVYKNNYSPILMCSIIAGPMGLLYTIFYFNLVVYSSNGIYIKNIIFKQEIFIERSKIEKFVFKDGRGFDGVYLKIYFTQKKKVLFINTMSKVLKFDLSPSLFIEIKNWLESNEYKVETDKNIYYRIKFQSKLTR